MITESNPNPHFLSLDRGLETDGEDLLPGGLENLPPGFAEQVQLSTGLAYGYSRFDSPVGEVMVGFRPQGVSWLRLPPPSLQGANQAVDPGCYPAQPPSAWAGQIAKAIITGSPRELPLDLEGLTSFRREVLAITATIPKGQVQSYRWVAEQVGSPAATRAVGTALAQNPIPLIIPCHRVVRSDGQIGKYSLGGMKNKQILLTKEAQN